MNGGKSFAANSELLGLLNGFPTQKVNSNCIRMEWLLSYLQSPQNRQDIIKYFEYGTIQHTSELETFYSFCKLIDFVAVESNKQSDFNCLRKLFRLGSVLGFSKQSCVMKCKQFYFKCDAWKNMSFWVDSVMVSVGSDMDRLENLKFGPAAVDFNKIFPKMDFIQIQSLFAMCRIQAFASNLLSVGQNKEDIDVFFYDVSNQIKLKDCRIDLHIIPSMGFIHDVLNTAMNLLSPSYLAVSNETIDRKWVGYSPLVELLFRILNSTTNKTMQHQHQIDIAHSNAARVQRSHDNQIGHEAIFCVCNTEIEHWKLLGCAQITEEAQTAAMPNNICSILCEHCYRVIKSNPLSVDADSIYCTGLCPAIRDLDEVYIHTQGNSLKDATFDYVFDSSDPEATMIRAPVKPDYFLLQTVLEDLQLAHTTAQRKQQFNDESKQSSKAVSPQNFKSMRSSVLSSKSLAGATMSPSEATTPVGPQQSELDGAKPRGLSKFVAALWVGITVKVIYSGKPVVEKVRLLYLRSDDHSVNSAINSLITTTDVAQRKKLLAMICSQKAMFVCWAHRSDKDRLSFQVDKAISLDTIKHIKVGSGKWKSCINVAGESKTLVLKIEDTELFNEVLEGLLDIVAARNINMKDDAKGDR